MRDFEPITLHARSVSAILASLFAALAIVFLTISSQRVSHLTSIEIDPEMPDGSVPLHQVVIKDNHSILFDGKAITLDQLRLYAEQIRSFQEGKSLNGQRVFMLAPEPCVIHSTFISVVNTLAKAGVAINLDKTGTSLQFGKAGIHPNTERHFRYTATDLSQKKSKEPRYATTILPRKIRREQLSVISLDNEKCRKRKTVGEA